MAVRPYYADLSAAYYDEVTARDRSLAGGLASPGAHILEVGAGTGRLAFGLAERGFRVTGVDIAPTMLDQARAKFARAPREVADRLTFVRGDMTALSVDGTFAAAIFP